MEDGARKKTTVPLHAQIRRALRHGRRDNPDFDDEVPTFAILTTAANELVGNVHDRMPVILPRTYEKRWLTALGYGHRNLPLTYPPDLMASYPVSTKVNKASFNEPAAIAPLEPEILL